MITLDEYVKDPCGKLSIPYWKAKNLKLPENMAVVHYSVYIPEQWAGFDAECYFRLYHDLKAIPETPVMGIRLETAEDVDTVVSIINRSYTDLQVNHEQILGYRHIPAFWEDLWVLARDISSGEAVGCALADFDREAGELSVEWVQVLPNHRGRGIGPHMVAELLRRGKFCARFATVSGRVDNETNPEKMYRKCGFSGEDTWYILRKKK